MAAEGLIKWLSEDIILYSIAVGLMVAIMLYVLFSIMY